MVNERQAVRWGIPAWFVGVLERVTALIWWLWCPGFPRVLCKWARWRVQAAIVWFRQAARQCWGQSALLERRVVWWSAVVGWPFRVRGSAHLRCRVVGWWVLAWHIIGWPVRVGWTQHVGGEATHGAGEIDIRSFPVVGIKPEVAVIQPEVGVVGFRRAFGGPRSGPAH